MSRTTPRSSPRAVLFSLLLACGDPAGAPPDAQPAPQIGLWFRDACRDGDRVVVAAVGDVLLHDELQRQAYASGHATLWREVAPLLAGAGAAYANLEGPTAAGIDVDWNQVPDPGPVLDGRVYTGFPRFNYHASVIPALAAAGIDVVSTANNHALDRGPLGVERTIAALEAGAMRYSGTRRGQARGVWWAITEGAGFRLAWLACSFSTNDPDAEHRTLLCDDDEAEIVRIVGELAARGDLDAVIVTPHGGDEYSHQPAPRQLRLAAQVLDAGAIAVFGNHPHVVQPWEKRVAPGGRETFVIYSIGNFVSGQELLPRRASAIVLLQLVRAGGETTIAGVRYVPTIMHAAPWSVWPVDRSADPAAGEAAALVADILDGENAMASNQPLDLGCR
jgi:poly-gamma-glutamate synthesis protein (capsule biosynthesis protein)